MKTIITISILALGLTACGKTESEASKSESKNANPYPLTTCVVSGEKLGDMGDPVVIQYEGREVRFCCKHCIPKFKKDPAKYLSKLDAKSSEADSSDKKP